MLIAVMKNARKNDKTYLRVTYLMSISLSYMLEIHVNKSPSKSSIISIIWCFDFYNKKYVYNHTLPELNRHFFPGHFLHNVVFYIGHDSPAYNTI